MTGLEDIVRLLADIDWAAWAVAWARVAPAVAIVPAFGLRALPAAARAFIALLLAALLVSAVRPAAHGLVPLPLAILAALAAGLPVALAAAVPLWAATMAGGTIDALRGVQPDLSSPTVEGRTSGLGVLFSLLAAVLFLAGGGPAHIVLALSAPAAPAVDPLARAVLDITGGISVAVAIAAPLIAASIVLEVAIALVARAAAPAQVHTSLAAARSLALLVLAALFFERIAALLARVAQHGPS
jgi:type III secretory pathway component EscT